MKGIDISSWQSGMPASSLNSVEFAILKLSEGTGWNDPAFNEFYNSAFIPLGAYVYSNATTEGEAQAEAIHALSLLNNRPLPLGVYIDIEEQRQLCLPDLTHIVTAFCEAIERGGYVAGAYGSAGNLWAKVDRSAIGDCIVWVASWGAKPGFGDLWQNSCEGRLPGYYFNVDTDEAISERFIALVNGTPAPKPAPAPEPDPQPSENRCSVTVQLPYLMNGSKGNAVRLLQQRLYENGEDPTSVDGIFGWYTQKAVENLQKKKGLVVDSIVGPLTWAKLLEV